MTNLRDGILNVALENYQKINYWWEVYHSRLLEYNKMPKQLREDFINFINKVRDKKDISNISSF